MKERSLVMLRMIESGVFPGVVSISRRRSGLAYLVRQASLMTKHHSSRFSNHSRISNDWELVARFEQDAQQICRSNAGGIVSNSNSTMQM